MKEPVQELPIPAPRPGQHVSGLPTDFAEGCVARGVPLTVAVLARFTFQNLMAQFGLSRATLQWLVQQTPDP